MTGSVLFSCLLPVLVALTGPLRGRARFAVRAAYFWSEAVWLGLGAWRLYQDTRSYAAKFGEQPYRVVDPSSVIWSEVAAVGLCLVMPALLGRMERRRGPNGTEGATPGVG